MPVILSLETSTEVCSVAISKDNGVLFSKESREEKSHASLLAVFIDEGIKKCKISYSGLDAVAISKGPGSYTGLRIGVSTAKGICYGANLPLIGISTLQTMTVGFLADLQFREKFRDAWFCPMLDARRMEVYTAFYNCFGQQISEISASIVDKDSYTKILNERSVFFFGNGAEKCKSIIKHNNAFFIDNIYPDAKNMIPLALESFNQKKFENEAYFEPFYLKDFIATVPKKDIYK